jgi:protein-S-isoprenylcysteine O-methyltransferase Ste14
VGILMAVLLTYFGTPVAATLAIGAALAVTGIAIRLWASGHIRKNRELATGGPYARVRHPLYVGNLLISIGFCLASGLLWAWPAMLAFWLVFYPNAVGEEDRKLERIFGEAWQAWSRETPALIPRLRGAGTGNSSWAFSRSLRLNGEPLIALFLLACLAALFYRL